MQNSGADNGFSSGESKRMRLVKVPLSSIGMKESRYCFIICGSFALALEIIEDGRWVKVPMVNEGEENAAE